MVIEIKYRSFSSPKFSAGLQKLGSFTGFEPKQAYNVARLISKVSQGEILAQQQYTELIKEYAQKDEKGDFVPVKGPDGAVQSGTFQIADGQHQALEEAQKKFGDRVLTIQRNKIPLEELKGVGLTPQELLAIEPCLLELEIVEEGESNGDDEKVQSIQKGKKN